MRTEVKTPSLVALALVTAGICGCTSKIDKQISDLAAARECWGLSLSIEYSFDLEKKCFVGCYGPVTIDVSLDEVVSVTPHDGVKSNRGEFIEFVPRIEDLFDKVLRYIERSSQDGIELDVTYDTDYGYPRSIVFRNSNLTDSNFETIVGNVTMMQAYPAREYDCGL